MQNSNKPDINEKPGPSSEQKAARYIEIPEEDPERHLKRIREVFQVSTRIQELVRRRKKSPPATTSDHDLKELVRIFSNNF